MPSNHEYVCNTLELFLGYAQEHGISSTRT